MSKHQDLTIRLAKLADADAISQLIESSVKALATTYYSKQQIELALVSAWGLDTQLIKDNCYYVVESTADCCIVGCGGWSYRKTLFGNDAEQNRNPETINIETGAAKIRAFFVDGAFARQGIGTWILNTCEMAGLKAGYKKFELMATLPGVKLYQRHGYLPQQTVHYPLSKSLTIEFVAMTKTPN